MQWAMSEEKGGSELAGVIWSTAVLLGVLQVVLGFFLVALPGITTLILVQILGIYWLVLGVVSIFQIFTGRGSVHWGWLLFSGILGILAGFLVLRHPYLGALATLGFLLYLIVLVGLLRGIISLVQGFKGEGGWNVFFGIVLIVISLYLMFNPLGAVVALPRVIGILALIGGVGLIFWGAEMRRKVSVARARLDTLRGAQ